ncbi:uncharacterized protein LOC143034556 [Oratosquilla oratoria]|uniref:uncharacterized protein LOC143034556 n=1 Tax=Oratosquilla oratoria TaxID=337810 RepID=UPI003F7698CE
MLECNFDENGDPFSGGRKVSYSCDPECSNSKDKELSAETHEELLGVQVEKELNRSIEALRKRDDPRTTALISIGSSSLSSTGGEGDSGGTQPRSGAVSAFLEDLELPSFSSSYGEECDDFDWKKDKLSEGVSFNSSRKILKVGECSRNSSNRVRGDFSHGILEDVEMPSFSSSVEEEEQLIVFEKSIENFRSTMGAWSPVKLKEESKENSYDPVNSLEKFLHGEKERTSSSYNDTVETSVSDQTLFREAQNVVFQLEDIEKKQDGFKRSFSPCNMRVTLGRGFKDLELEELNDSLLGSPQKFKPAIVNKSVFSTSNSIPIFKVDEEEFVNEAEAIAAHLEELENVRLQESQQGNFTYKRLTLGKVKMLDIGSLDEEEEDFLTSIPFSPSSPPPSPSPPPPSPSPPSDLQSYKAIAKTVQLNERKYEKLANLNSTFDRDKDSKSCELSQSARPQKANPQAASEAFNITFQNLEPPTKRENLQDQLKRKSVVEKLNSTFDQEEYTRTVRIKECYPGNEGIIANSTFDKIDVPKAEASGTHNKVDVPDAEANRTFDKIDGPNTSIPQAANSTFDKIVVLKAETSGTCNKVDAPNAKVNRTFDKIDVPNAEANGTFDKIEVPQEVANGTFDIDDEPRQTKAAPIFSETPTKGMVNIMDASQDELDANFCSTPNKGSNYQPINSTPVALPSLVTKDPRKSFLHRLSCNIRNQASKEDSCDEQGEDSGKEQHEMEGKTAQHQPAILSQLGSVTQGEVANRLLKMRRGPLRSLHGPLKVMHKGFEGSRGSSSSDVPSCNSVKSSIPSLGSVSSIGTDGERPGHLLTADSPDLVFRVESTHGGQMITSTPSHYTHLEHLPISCTPIAPPLHGAKVDITPQMPCNEDVFEEKDATPLPTATVTTAVKNISPVPVKKLSAHNTLLDGMSPQNNLEGKKVPLNTTVDNVPLNTTMDRIAPLNTRVDEAAPLNITVDKVVPLNTTMDQIAPLNTRVDQVVPLNTTMDQLVPLNTTMDQLVPLNTTMDKAAPLNTTVDQVAPLITTVDQVAPLNTTMDQVAPHNTRVDKEAPLNIIISKVAPLNITIDKVAPLNITIDKVAPLNITIDKVAPLNITIDKVAPLITVDQVAPLNTTFDRTAPHNTILDQMVAPLNTTMDHVAPLNTTVDEVAPLYKVDQVAPFENLLDKTGPLNTTVDQVASLSTIYEEPQNATVDQTFSVSAPQKELPLLSTNVDSVLHKKTDEAPQLKTTVSNSFEPSNTVTKSVTGSPTEPLRTNRENGTPPCISVGILTQPINSPVDTVSAGLNDAINTVVQTVSDNITPPLGTTDHKVPFHSTSGGKSDSLPTKDITDSVAPELKTIMDDGKLSPFSILEATTAAPLTTTVDVQVNTAVDNITPNFSTVVDNESLTRNNKVDNEALDPVTKVNNESSLVTAVNNIETCISTVKDNKTLIVSAVVDKMTLPGKTSLGSVVLNNSTSLEIVTDPEEVKEPEPCDNTVSMDTVKSLNENNLQVTNKVMFNDEMFREKQSPVYDARCQEEPLSKEELFEQKSPLPEAVISSGRKEEGSCIEEENKDSLSVKCEDLVNKESGEDESKELKFLAETEENSEERGRNLGTNMNKKEIRMEDDIEEKKAMDISDRNSVNMEKITKKKPQKSYKKTPLDPTLNKTMSNKRPQIAISSSTSKLKVPQEVTQGKTDSKLIKRPVSKMLKVSCPTSIQSSDIKKNTKLVRSPVQSAVQASKKSVTAGKLQGGNIVNKTGGTEANARLGSTQAGSGRLSIGSGIVGLRGSNPNLARKTFIVTKKGTSSVHNKIQKSSVSQTSDQIQTKGANLEVPNSHTQAKPTNVKKFSIAPRMISSSAQKGKENCPVRMSSSIKDLKPMKSVESGTRLQEPQRSVLQTRNGTPTADSNAHKLSKISISDDKNITVSAGLPNKKSGESQDISAKKTPSKTLGHSDSGGMGIQRRRGMLGGTPRKCVSSPMQPVQLSGTDVQSSLVDRFSQPSKIPPSSTSTKPSGLKLPQIRTSRIPASISRLRPPSSRISVESSSKKSVSE